MGQAGPNTTTRCLKLCDPSPARDFTTTPGLMIQIANAVIGGTMSSLLSARRNKESVFVQLASTTLYGCSMERHESQRDKNADNFSVARVSPTIRPGGNWTEGCNTSTFQCITLRLRFFFPVPRPLFLGKRILMLVLRNLGKVFLPPAQDQVSTCRLCL